MNDEDVHGDGPSSSPPSDWAPEIRARACVWVIDDSPLQAEACRKVLASTFEVAVFTDPARALEQLTAKKADVLVLDWHMPLVSGLEVCRYLRQTSNLAELPILVLTAAGTGTDVLEALAAGANDYVTKPFSTPELLARVSSLVQLRHLHSRLNETEAALRLEAEFRERFMGMLAHDLRQPLNTMSMAHQLSSQSGASAERLAGFSDMHRRAVERMTRMIRELLDFARNRPGSAIPLSRQPAALDVIVRATVSEIALSLPDRLIRLEVDGSVGAEVDADRIAQVIGNLVGNALEHGAAGSPVAIRLSGQADQVELRVTSQGAPIAPTLLPNLFQAFRQGRKAKASSGSVGLGLHIVDLIVRAHGGTVEVQSGGDETTFCVILPRQPPQVLRDWA